MHSLLKTNDWYCIMLYADNIITPVLGFVLELWHNFRLLSSLSAKCWLSLQYSVMFLLTNYKVQGKFLVLVNPSCAIKWKFTNPYPKVTGQSVVSWIEFNKAIRFMPSQHHRFMILRWPASTDKLILISQISLTPDGTVKPAHRPRLGK